MPNQNIKIHACKLAWNTGVSLLLADDDNGIVAEPIVWKKVEHEYTEDVPTVNINTESAQFLMDQLWGLGFRPNQKVGYEGQLQAVNKHLEDMRELVFSPKNPNKPVTQNQEV